MISTNVWRHEGGVGSEDDLHNAEETKTDILSIHAMFLGDNHRDEAAPVTIDRFALSGMVRHSGHNSGINSFNVDFIDSTDTLAPRSVRIPPLICAMINCESRTSTPEAHP